MKTRCLFALTALVTLTLAVSCAPAAPQPAEATPVPATSTPAPKPTAIPTPVPPTHPFCLPGETPRFVFGIADLKQQLGAQMGDPIECEHVDPSSGDTIQLTTTGLAYYRQRTNTPTFFNGLDRWALTDRGLVQWSGDSLDPPG